MQFQQFSTAHTSGSPRHSPRKPTWRVVLGRAAWSRHTYERPAGGDLKLIGSVSKGPQVGALAMTIAGDYVQVVGDHVTLLNTKDARAVAKAVAKAPKEFDAGVSAAVPRQTPRREVPVVVVKKRRVAVMP